MGYSNNFMDEEERRRRLAQQQVLPQSTLSQQREQVRQEQNGFGTQPQQSNQNFGTTSSTQNTMSGANNSWTTPPVASRPQFDNTRDAVAYAWDKQHPYGGMTKMTGPLGDISYYDENLNKPKEADNKAYFDNAYPVLRDDKRNTFNTGIEQYVKNMPKNFLGNTPLGQVFGATRDMGENYINMLNANIASNDEMKTKGTTIDNYYHCIGNYNAAQRGPWGEQAAVFLGNKKEDFDYYKNRLRGDSSVVAEQDRVNDLAVNRDGVNMAKNGQYNSAEEACNKYRPESYDEDEERKKWYRRYYRKY